MKHSQFRHWIAVTSTPQVLSAAVAVVIACAFVTVSLVVAPDPTVGVAGANTGLVGGAPGGGGTGLAAGGTPGGAATASTSGAPGGGAAGGSSTGGGATGAAGGDGSGSGSTGGSVALTASDRGVTESTLRLGVIIPNDALGNAGFSPGVRSDFGDYAMALGEYVNAQGGVGGRQVEVVVRPTDPTSTTDQDAACQGLLNDHQVFGVIDLALSNGPAQACIAQQGQTPYVHLIPWSRDFQGQSGGYDVTYAAAIDRIAVALARDLAASGWLDSNSVVGVFGDNCPTTKPTVDDVLVAALQRVAGRVEVGLHDCTIEGALRQPPNVATRFRTAGVDRVLSVANYVSTQVFLQTASGLGGWQPRYAVSDWFVGVSDGLSENYNPDQFDGAVGLTSTRRPLLNAGRTGYPGVERCNDAAAAAGLPPVDEPDADSHVALCDLFFLMIDGIAAAGPNPTRPAWAAAIQSLGQRSAVAWGPSTFASGKTNGADQLYTAVWHRDCTCWRAESDFRAIDG